MYYWNKICGFLTIFFLCALFSRAQTANKSLITAAANPVSILPLTKTGNQSFTPSLNVISPNYYTQHMGFMCKKELALQKITKVPLRFRLGSLQQCNYLEGKK